MTTKRHGTIPGEGAGKGCCRRRGEDDKSFADNMKVIREAGDKSDTSGFVMKINGKVV